MGLADGHRDGPTDGPSDGLSRPLTVAVTGGIGAGKSTVSRALGSLGAVVIDSDQLAREVVAPGTAGLDEIVDAFGPAVLDGRGALDRPALGAIVFDDPDARGRLESITHPKVRALFGVRVAEAGSHALVVNDIPLLRTVQDAARYHLVITVGMADEELRIERLIARGHTEADARARIAAQLDDDARRVLSDVWIDNSGSPDALQDQVDVLHERLVRFGRHRRDRVAAPARMDPRIPPESPLHRRILDAIPGASLDPAGRLAVGGGAPVPEDRWTKSLQDSGFAWFPDTPADPSAAAGPVGIGTLGSCDPGRPVRFSVVLSA